MRSIIFHSFYNDPNLTSLKHSIFYFDKLYIPADNFVIAYMESGAQSTSNVHLVNLLPGEIYDDINNQSVGSDTKIDFCTGPIRKYREYTEKAARSETDFLRRLSNSITT